MRNLLKQIPSVLTASKELALRGDACVNGLDVVVIPQSMSIQLWHVMF